MPHTKPFLSRRVVCSWKPLLLAVPRLRCRVVRGSVVEAELSTTVVESVMEVVAQLREVRNSANRVDITDICSCVAINTRRR